MLWLGDPGTVSCPAKSSVDTACSGSTRVPAPSDVKSSTSPAGTHLPAATTFASAHLSQVEGPHTSTSAYASVNAVNGASCSKGVASAPIVPIVEVTGPPAGSSTLATASTSALSGSLQQSATVSTGGPVCSFPSPQQSSPEPVSVSTGSTMVSSIVSPASSGSSASVGSSTVANKSTLKKVDVCVHFACTSVNHP